MGEGVHKGVLPRIQLHKFPPTTTEKLINSWLEVTTSTREGGKRAKIGTWENHEHAKVRSNYKSNYLNRRGISPTKQHSCWVYGPYLLMLPTTRRPTRASNREINQKLLTLLELPACLTVLHGN